MPTVKVPRNIVDELFSFSEPMLHFVEDVVFICMVHYVTGDYMLHIFAADVSQ